MAFQPCYLLEIGFIDHNGDRNKMIDPALRRQACNAIADILLQP
jgi:N-acetylmuramoyl-L-alanine amidase